MVPYEEIGHLSVPIVLWPGHGSQEKGQGRLFGIFQASSPYLLASREVDMSYVPPDGVELTGRTTYVLTNRAPGPYAFRLNEWDARAHGLGNNGDLFVALLHADVALP